MPFGLHGDLILPSASCKQCAAITSDAERFVLRDMLGLMRTKYGFRSQNRNTKRNPPKPLILKHEHDGRKTPITLDPPRSPFFSWSLPLWGFPGMAWHEAYEVVCANDTLYCVVGQLDAQAALDAAGGKHVVSLPEAKFSNATFARFLAKVAHSFAVAALGADGFHPVLPNFIRNGGDKPRIFVGGELEIPPAQPYAYEIDLGTMQSANGSRYLAVRMRLLSYLGTPVYTVIVGDRFEGDLASVGHGYAKPIQVAIMGDDGVPIFSAGQ
ncbi:hypothetical protein [Sphingomonas turrisvirgatae]|nr:hypothetical protein [Sphingomonas turrisvirgatae]